MGCVLVLCLAVTEDYLLCACSAGSNDSCVILDTFMEKDFKIELLKLKSLSSKRSATVLHVVVCASQRVALNQSHIPFVFGSP